MKKIYTFLFFIFCLAYVRTQAQTRLRISGMVTDTAKSAISSATVLLITDTDTLKTATDDYGHFTFRTNAGKMTLLVSSVGYETKRMEYKVLDKGKHQRVSPVQLSPAGRMLEEVVIRGKPNPVRFMKDTVEYNAAAFQVMEGDNVADLLKQLPAMEIDENYRAKVMGKEMTKLRVNGEDFFTSNVQDFISKLPAGIVDKIQVIDDFGDEANFTGIKTGEPQKMLNIVTKPGVNKGAFGNGNAATGTNDMAGGRADLNLWNKTKQSSANLNINTSDNGAGNTSTLGLGISHRDKIGKTGILGMNYNASHNRNAFFRQQVAESVNPEGGTLSSNSQSNGGSNSKNHSLGGTYTLTDKKWYLNARFTGGYNTSENNQASVNNQFGLLRQDLHNGSLHSSSNPRANIGINLSKKLKNTRNSLSANIGVDLYSRNGNQDINTNVLYYDKITGELQKDSLLRRSLQLANDDQNLRFGLNYSFGLKKGKDSLARRSLNISYSGQLSLSDQHTSTFVTNNITNQNMFVDSLSTAFRSSTFNQNMAIKYNYDSGKIRFNTGINARPNLTSNYDLRLGRKITNNTFNYAPNVDLGLTLSKGKTISFQYNGHNLNPTIEQLQPIRNAVNLQNILVGNPDLKPSFRHNIDGSFNASFKKSGLSFQMGLNANTTQNAIVNHVILIPDTLNSLKQITKYENIDGNYSVGGNYYINIPVWGKKHHINYSGSAGISNQAVIFNNQRAFGKGLNFSQNLSANIKFKKAIFSARASYSISNGSNADQTRMMYLSSQDAGLGQFAAPAFFRRTNFSSDLSGNMNLKNLRLQSAIAYNTSKSEGQLDERFRSSSRLNMNLSAYSTIRKSYHANFRVSKEINSGFALANSNPLVLNMSIGKSFLKDKKLSCSIEGNDLLGQGNNISRIVSGNTIIDQRSNQTTRTYSFRLAYALSRFGGKHFAIHPD